LSHRYPLHLSFKDKVLRPPVETTAQSGHFGSTKVGETRRAIDIAFPSGSIDLTILSEHRIVSYDYTHSNAGDDFLNVVERVLIAKTIVVATSVYWYAMSAPMKIFFDRMADLMQTAKEKGRELAGKNTWLLSTGEETLVPDGFEAPTWRKCAKFSACMWNQIRYCWP
jgi:NADPH-dependent FMN reductase